MHTCRSFLDWPLPSGGYPLTSAPYAHPPSVSVTPTRSSLNTTRHSESWPLRHRLATPRLIRERKGIRPGRAKKYSDTQQLQLDIHPQRVNNALLWLWLVQRYPAIAIESSWECCVNISTDWKLTQQFNPDSQLNMSNCHPRLSRTDFATYPIGPMPIGESRTHAAWSVASRFVLFSIYNPLY